MNLSESKAKIRRRSIKAAATRLRNYIDSPQAEHATKFELAERKRKLANLFEQYDEVQSRIECLASNIDAELTANHSEDRAHFEEAYFYLMSLFDQRLSLLERLDVIQPDNSHAQNNPESHIQLPKIQLLSFSESYENWYTFHDSFEKLIHANENLSTIEKFHYL